MLEQNITQIDRDFMILYSRYTINYLYGEEDEFYIDYDTTLNLVKLGQLNAIQLYYNEPMTPFKYGYHNEIIKESKQYSYYPNSYNELYTASCIYFVDEYSQLQNDLVHKIWDENDKINLEKLENVKNNSKGYKYLQLAINEATRINNDSPNLLLEAFIYEMKLNSRFVRLLRQARRNNHGEEIVEYENELKEYVRVKNRLKEELKKDPSNDVLAFTLAKSIRILKRFDKVSAAEMKLLRKIFKEIGYKREYSYLMYTKNNKR